MNPRNEKCHYSTWWLGAILVLAAMLRVWYLAGVIHAPDFKELRQDMSVQDYHARAILSRDWTLPEGRNDPKIATTPYYRPPAYTYLLSVIYLVSGGSYLAPRIFNVMLGLISIVLMYRLAKRLFGSGVGLVTAALMATYWGFIYYEGEVNDPAVFVFLLPCLLFSLYRWKRGWSVKWIVLAGLITGCYALMRPNILLYGPVMAVWLLWVAWREKRMKAAAAAWAALACATALTIAPVTIRNYVVSGEFVPISTYFGENLHIGNSDYADGYTSWTPYLQQLEGSGQFSVWEYDRIVRGLGREVGNEKLTHSEASNIFMRKALEWVSTHKWAALRLTVKKALLFWSPWEITENKVVHYEKSCYAPLKYMPGFPYVFALFLFGTVFLFRDWVRKSLPWQRDDAYSSARDMLLLIYGFILTYWFSFLPFFVNERARHPLVGLLMLIGAYGLCRFVRIVREKRPKAVAALTALLLLFFCFASLELVSYRPDKARWRYARADSWLRAGEVEKAKAEAEKLLEEDYSLYMPFRIGHALALKGEHRLAEKLLRAALGTEKEPVPYRQDLYFHIGVVLAADGRDQEAREAYEEALRLNPKDSRAHNDLGVLLEKAGDLEGARAQYRAALDANPEFALAWSNLGDLLGRLGEHEGAAEAFRNALEILPEDPEYAYNLAVHLAGAGKTVEAVAQYETVLNGTPRDVRALNNLGLLLADQGETEEAKTLFQRALQYAPAYSLARANLGNLLVRTGDFDGGIRVYREGLELDPENVDLLNGIGYQYAVHGDVKQAITYYENALRLAPGFILAKVNLAYACLQAGDSERALKTFEQLSGEEPDKPAFLLEMGNLHAGAQRYEDAVRCYKRALEIDPKYQAALKNLEVVRQLQAAKTDTGT